MHKILLLVGSVALFAVAGLAQSPRVVPCLVDVGAKGADGKHVADWQPREAIRGVFKIEPGKQIVMPFAMPVEGQCEAHVLAFDDREATALEGQDSASEKTSRKLPPAEAEVIILDPAGMEARNREEKFEAKFTGRAANGQLNAQLAAGDYFIVISNKDSNNIPIKVFFWLGHVDKPDLSEK